MSAAAESNVIPFPGADARQIVSFGGGGFSMEAGNPLLDDYVLSLTGEERPKVCFLPTASGDADHYIVRFYRAFPGSRCIPSHLSLFRRERGAEDVRAHLLGQDLIYVGGGSVLSMLGVWRAHGLDSILRECWEAGIVLCGLSAGSLCWFSEGVTSFHDEVRRFRGLGLLPWSNCVDYGDEPARRGAYHEHLGRGMCPGYAAADGAALHFRGARMVAAVSSRPEAKAWCAGDSGPEIVETELPIRYLGRPDRGSGGRPSGSLSGVRSDRGPIVAIGGAEFVVGLENELLHDYVVAQISSTARPRVCLLPTAGGDPQHQIGAFVAAMERRGCATTAVSLFRLGESEVDLRSHLLSQDLIYVTGGNMVNLMALWREHRIDEILTAAHHSGVGLCGVQRRIDVLVRAGGSRPASARRSRLAVSACSQGATARTTCRMPSGGGSTVR